MADLAQVRRLAFNDEEIGMGFDSRTGLAVGSALEGFTVAENPVASGAEVTSSISIVSTYEELQETLGLSFEAEGRYGLVAGSAKAQFSEKTNYNSMSTFVVASVVVENPLRRGRGFRITAEAKALLDALQTETFARAFGDGFVRGLQTGGEFYAVVRITSVSTSVQAALSASLQAEYNGLIASGSFKAAFEKTNASENTRSEFTTVMYQRAGSGVEISPTVTIDEVIARFTSFPQIAKNSASAYETEVATYDTIPLPVPTPTEQEAFLDALADAREHRMFYIQKRNDLEFALRFPEFFDNPPGPAELESAALVYTKLMNAVTQHAIKLSKGQLNPPQFFEPPLPEPLDIQLKKKDVGATLLNMMPNLVGQLAEPVVSLLSCVAMENVDHCLTFLGSSLDGLGLDSRELGTFFFTVLRSGVTPDVQGDPGASGARVTAQSPPPGVPVEPLGTLRIEVSA